MKNKSDYETTFKVIFVTIVMSLTVFTFHRLEMGVKDSILQTAYMIVPLFILGIMMFNYLQYGIFWLWVSKANKFKHENKF